MIPPWLRWLIADQCEPCEWEGREQVMAVTSIAGRYVCASHADLYEERNDRCPR